MSDATPFPNNDSEKEFTNKMLQDFAERLVVYEVALYDTVRHLNLKSLSYLKTMTKKRGFVDTILDDLKNINDCVINLLRLNEDVFHSQKHTKESKEFVKKRTDLLLKKKIEITHDIQECVDSLISCNILLGPYMWDGIIENLHLSKVILLKTIDIIREKIPTVDSFKNKYFRYIPEW